MKIAVIITFIFIGFACGQKSSTDSKSRSQVDSGYQVKACDYSVSTIPDFFEAVVAEHLKELKIIDASQFKEFCNSNNLDPENSVNTKRFYTITFLHKFFTCQSAANGSRGNIINISYYWHWVNPNPRYDIFLQKSNTKISELKPPKEFSKYRSFADIDRTPFLFLSELFLDTPKYYSSLSDTFSTFGWCSEREMAFVSLMGALGYKGKVIAEGNHSWSEFIIPMMGNKNESQEFKVKIDNTFDASDWNEVSSAEVVKWNGYQGESKQANWYNLQAHSVKEKEKIEMFPISQVAVRRIENSIVDYLSRAINEH